jgi:DNA topoisomerase IA
MAPWTGWSFLIENNFSPHYIVMKKAQKTVKHLKLQAKGKEGIFLAPDPDREGEAISWHLAHLLKEVNEKAEVRRLLLNIPDFRNISQQFFQQTGVVHAQPIRPLQEQRKQDVRLDLKR